MELLIPLLVLVYVLYRFFVSTRRSAYRAGRIAQSLVHQVTPTTPRPTVSPAPVSPAPHAALVGPCYVIDGDTIDIRGTRIRLAGIDAPELDDPYGKSAKFHLIKLCKGFEVRAVFDGALSHDRSVATCFLPDGRDLSEEMVKAGLAIDWRKFSGGKYRQFEPEGVRKKLWRCDARQKGLSAEYMPD